MSAPYVYIRIPGAGIDGNALRTVGFYDPDGKWNAESDHDTDEQAAARVSYLNGSACAARSKEGTP